MPPTETLRGEILDSKILLVEDDPLSRAVLGGILRREGFHSIEEAENGRIGLSKLPQFRPDLIISDILMPEMDGFALCAQVHNDPDPEIARTPILIQTGLTQESDKAKIFAAGATDYLSKPIDAQEVIARLVLHLERGLILKRLQKFNGHLAHERGETIEPEKLEGEYWSFKRLSGTINSLLDEIELSHYDIKQAKEKAERANRIRTEFLASITHDFKTPVHCITNFAAMGISALQKGKPEPLPEYLNDILSNGTRLDSLISDILDFSKIESGHMDFQLKPTAVRDIASRAVAFTRAPALAKQIQVQYDSSLTHDIVMADARRLEQVFVNLMSNAIRFSPHHGYLYWKFEQSSMRIPGTELDVPAITIRLRDEGPGIPETELQSIFEPFVQSSQQPRKPGSGSGLGLTICRRLLQAFYGTITASNAAEGGAVFTIQLPLHTQT